MLGVGLLASALLVAALALAAGSISADPDSIDFGSRDVDDGPSATQASTITNAGPDPVAINSVSLVGPDTDQFFFDPQPGDCDGSTVLNMGESCDVHAYFDPTSTGAKSATLRVSSPDGDADVALAGNGTQTELTAAPDSLAFAEQDVDDGATAVQTSVVENTGTETVDLDAVTLGGTDADQFTRLSDQGTDCTAATTLTSGQSCEVRVEFDPTTTGAKSATATVDSNAPDEVIALSGTGTQTELTADPDSLAFGSQDVDDGATAVQTSVVENTGTQTVDLDAVTLGGADPDQFTRLTDQGTDCTAATTLTSGQSCEVRVEFDPTTTGAKSASVTVESTAPDETVALSGTGTQTELTAAPDSLAFGSQDIDDGATAAETSTVTNTGTETVTLDAVVIGGADAGEFEQVSPVAGDCQAGTVLAAAETCDVRVTFDPTTTGGKSATVTVESDAPDETIALSGTGTQTELTATPTTLIFGDQDVNEGPTATQASVIENTGTESVSVAAVNATGDTTEFERLTDQGTDCTDSTSLAAGETCNVRVRFNPTTTGAKSVTYTVDSDAPDVTVDASGTGTLKELTPDPASLPFGDQDVDAGPTASQTSSVENTGDQPVTIAAVTIGGANPKQFQRLTGALADCAPATTLQPAETCDVRIVFDPSFKGAKSATVTVDSNAPDATIALSGNGIESVFESSDDALDEGYVTNGQVNAVAFDSAGRTYLGGTFTFVGPRTGHGVKLSAASDDPAGGFPDVDGTVRAVVPDGSGGWFIGGDFMTVGGVPRSRLAHIESSGALDTAWDPSADGRVNALAVSGGSLFVGGEFAMIDGNQRAFAAKLSTTTGEVDATWNPIVNGRVLALAVNGSGVHLAGEFTQIGPETRNRLARVASTGSGALDESWDPDANGAVNAIALSATDVYVGGGFTTVGGETRQRIARLDPTTGAPDPAWTLGADNTVLALAVSGSDVYAGGTFTSIGGQPRNRAAELSATTGAADATFNPDANAPVHTLAVSGAGVYAGGEFTQIGGQSRSRLARLSPADGLADGWDPTANGTARAIALDGTNVYAGGDFTSVGATARNRLARLEPDGTLDTDWNPDANGTVSALVVSGTDVYVGGSFTSVGGQLRDRIAKLSTAGSAADASWDPGATGTVSALAVSGTTVYAGGLFLNIDGQARSRLARLTGANGDLDIAWAPAGAGGQVNALALSGSDLYVGGAFTTIAGAPRNRIAKLDAGGTGAVDPGWDPDASNTVTALAVAGSDLYVGGFFATIGGEARSFVAELDTTSGVADPDWDPSPNGVVRALAVNATDVYAGGEFTEVADEPHGRLAKVSREGTGAPDAGWDPAVTGGSVFALAIAGDRLAVGGSFTATGGQSSQGFALLELPTLTADPGGLAFGERDVDDGPTATLTSTITNPRAETVTFTSVSLGGPDASQFERLTSNPEDCTATTVLDEDETCTVRVRFDPTSPGPKTASVAIVSNSPGIEVALTGTGAQTALVPDPASLSFGSRDIDDGPTATQTSTVTNEGTEQVDFSAVTLEGTDPTQFERLADQPGDCLETTILQPTQSCEVRVRFDPSTTGGKSATVTIESTAPEVSVALSGTGIQTQLSRSPATLAFGPRDIDDGPTATQTSVVTNSGTETVTLTGVDTTGDADQFVRLTGDNDDCGTGTVLTAGQTCNVREQFDPATVGAKSATVTVTSNAADVTVALTGTGTQTQLTADPDSLAFGSRDVDEGPTATQESVVTNTGTEPITIAAVNVTGDTADFVRLTDEPSDCEATDALAPTETCNVRVQFDPATVGAKSATVTVDSNAPDETIALTGTGIQTELSRAPTSLSFGSQDIDDGPTAVQESTVTNSGTETVDLDAVSLGGTNADQFAQLTDQGTDCTAATTLTAGQTCKLRIRFDPATVGAKTASVTVESNAADVSVALDGTGIQTLLTRSPATLAFGNQNINDGPTAAQESTVTNSGTESVTFTAIDFTGDTSQFERLTGQPTDCTATTTLAAGETCKLRARFDPTTTGGKSATLTVDSNAADVSVALTGTGVLTQLQRSQNTLAFGQQDIDDGPTAAQTSTITNSGSETVTFSSIAMTGDTTHFERLTGQPSDCTDSTVLTAGQTCDVRARFDPTTTGALSATITISSNAADQVISLTGTGIQTLLTRSPDTLAFGDRDIDDGPTAVQTSTVTNSGTETVDLDGVDVTGDSAHFERLTDQGSDCTAATTLTAGQTCDLRLRFDPTTVGAKTATVTVDSNAPDVTVALSGTGTQTQLTADPDSQGFGSQDIDDGATAAQTSVIENTGTESVTFTGITVDSGWVRLTGDAGDCATTETLAAGEECDLRLAFDPSATGAQTGSATIASNAPDETVALSGTGIQTLLTRSPTSLSFGNRDINEGPTAAQESTITNSGTESVDLDAITAGGTDPGHFERLTGQGTDCSADTTLTAGQTCKVRLRFDPTTTGAKAASFTVESNAADVAVLVDGTGILSELTAGTATLAFGDRDIDDGASATLESVVTNTGTETVTISGVSLTGDDAHFARLTDEASDCAATDVLAAGDTCKVRAQFDPSTVGAKTATVTIDSTAPDETVGLTGTGIQTLLTRSPDTLPFGSRDIDDGPTAVQTSTVTNAGTETVDLDAVTFGGSDPGHFEQVTGQGSDCTASTTLTAGQTCELRLRFDPTTTGAKAATATVESNAADVAVALSGTGIQTLLTRSPDTLPFGSQDIDDGATAVQTSTVTNAGSETVDLDSVDVTGDSGQFERLTSQATDCTATTTLTAGQTCELRLRFDPTTTGAKAATVTVDSNAADVTVALSGTGTQTLLTRSPATLSFGDKDVDDGVSVAQASIVTNAGSEPVTLSAVDLTGDTDHFDHLDGAEGDCMASVVLTAGQTCDVRLRFDPETTGGKSLTVTIDSNAADVTVTASGTGIQTELSRSPADLSFGARDIDDGATATQESTVTNSGTESVTLSSVAVTGDSSQFVRLTSQASDCEASDTLAAGQTCKLRFQFDPTTTGAKAATATVDSNAPDVTLGLTGTGTQTLLSRSPSSLSFGSRDIDDGPTAAQESTITNSGSEAVDLDAVTLGGAGAGQFERLTGQGTDCSASTSLAAGETCKVRARFDPTSVGAKAATVTVESNAADVTVGLTGTGIQTLLSRSPSSLSFGSRDIDDGPTAAQESTVTNAGTEPVTISSVDTTGQFERLAGDAADCAAGDTLAAGDTCDLRARFDPSTTGAKSGTITVSSNAADVAVDLSGTGTQTQLSRAPASLPFGSREVDDGPSAAQTATITNTGTEPVDVNAVTVGGADAAHFERLTGQASDCSSATTLSAGDTCAVRMRFDPSSRGAKAATVTVDSNAPDVTAALSGTGIDTELTAAPASLAFGARDIDDGPTATQTSTVTNTGTEAVSFTSAALTTNAAAYEVLTGAADDCDDASSLAPGEDCNVRVRFDPASVGAKPSSFEIDSNAPTTAIAISGTGTQTELTRAPAALAFGAHDIDAGATLAQESTVTNSGTEPVTLAGVTVTGPDAGVFERLTGQASDCAAGDTLTAGEVCRVRMRFDPATTGARTAAVSIDAQAPANDLTVDLSGTGVQLELSRSTSGLALGAQDVDNGPTAAQGATITNTGSEPVGIAGVGLSGDDAAQFERLTGDGADCDAGRTLAAGETCNLRARFDPSTTGPKAAFLTLDSNAEDVSVALTGTGTQTGLSLTPPTLAFGARNLGEGPSALVPATVRNTGTEPVTLNAVAIGGPGAGDFSVAGGLPFDCGPGRVLGAGDQCAVRTAFDPSTTGDKAATLTVTSTAPDVIGALTGTGTMVRLVLGNGPTRASQTNRRRFRVQLSALGGTVPRVTLTLSRSNGRRIKRMVVTDVSTRRSVSFRLNRRLRRGQYKVTATAPRETQVGPATRTYRLR